MKLIKSIGARESREPTTNTVCIGKISQRKPYVSAERAEPPTQAEEKAPRIAPLFSSGRASTIEALKMLLPAQLRKDAMNMVTHIGKNDDDMYVITINTTESENPIAIIQNLTLGLNFTIPSSNMHAREPMVIIDIK